MKQQCLLVTRAGETKIWVAICYRPHWLLFFNWLVEMILLCPNLILQFWTKQTAIGDIYAIRKRVSTSKRDINGAASLTVTAWVPVRVLRQSHWLWLWLREIRMWITPMAGAVVNTPPREMLSWRRRSRCNSVLPGQLSPHCDTKNRWKQPLYKHSPSLFFHGAGHCSWAPQWIQCYGSCLVVEPNTSPF